jgi:hypothetical protein
MPHSNCLTGKIPGVKVFVPALQSAYQRAKGLGMEAPVLHGLMP